MSCEASEPHALLPLGKWNEEKITLNIFLEGTNWFRPSLEAHAVSLGKGEAGGQGHEPS